MNQIEHDQDQCQEPNLWFAGVSPIFSDEDIDNDGHGIWPILCCLGCRQEMRTRWGVTSTYLLACLYCPECLETVVEVWQ